MRRETHLLIYVAPLLEHEFDLFKVGHTTITAMKGRRSQLRCELGEPKLELYPMVVYPPSTPNSTVHIHERDLIWMVRLTSLPLFRHPTTKIKHEVVYFPTTPAMRFWDVSEPDKRERALRLFPYDRSRNRRKIYLDDVLMPLFEKVAIEEGGWENYEEFAEIARSAAKRGKSGVQKSEIRSRVKKALKAIASD
jgi:hypothetical protein